MNDDEAQAAREDMIRMRDPAKSIRGSVMSKEPDTIEAVVAEMRALHAAKAQTYTSILLNWADRIEALAAAQPAAGAGDVARIREQLELCVSTMDEEYEARYGRIEPSKLKGMRVPAVLRAYRNLVAGILKNTPAEEYPGAYPNEDIPPSYLTFRPATAECMPAFHQPPPAVADAPPSLDQIAARKGFDAMPDPLAADLHDPLFEAIWQATKTWDVNVPEFYFGYCGLTGSHVMLILNAIRQARPQAGEWLPISEAPRDGTEILIWRAGWDYAPLAKWGENTRADEPFYGWVLHESVYPVCACEEGFLGWNEDIEDGHMPTHWLPAPSAAEKGETK